jgi:hypothetical protein
MRLTRMRKASALLAGVALLALMTGCRVRVDKSANGEDKNVQVDTPFGGVHVNTNQTTAADLGLPVYPGSETVSDDDKHKSADVHLGFGEWEMRVKVVSYASADTQDQVVSFYKKALGSYGDVITCQGNTPVGTPAMTSGGLTCSADKSGNVQIDRGDYGASKNGMQLKAGSKRHQHIVGFEEPKDGKTRFALVALDLPAGADKGGEKSD